MFPSLNEMHRLTEEARRRAQRLERADHPPKCAVCGKELPLGRRFYCSNDCANKAYWERRRARHKSESTPTPLGNLTPTPPD